jgi:hypothetical protein
MKNNVSISDLLEDVLSEPIPLIHNANVKSAQSVFSGKNEALRAIFNVQSSSASSIETTLDELGQKPAEQSLFGSDSLTLKAWKNIENISARLIEHSDDIVVLECLLDKELGIYEEREFRKTLFEGYELKIGNLFYLRFFDRQNETRMEIHNDPRLTSVEDFPKKNFVDLFKNSKLFKK